jgi:hypothetical protein
MIDIDGTMFSVDAASLLKSHPTSLLKREETLSKIISYAL